MSAFHFETYFTRTILNLLTDDNKQYCNPLVHCSNCFLNPIQDNFQTLLLVTKHEFHIKLKTKHGKVDMTEYLKLKKKNFKHVQICFLWQNLWWFCRTYFIVKDQKFQMKVFVIYFTWKVLCILSYYAYYHIIMSCVKP